MFHCNQLLLPNPLGNASDVLAARSFYGRAHAANASNQLLWQITAGGVGTVTSVATSGLATGGTITATGTVTVTAATQADQETGTSTTVAVVPGVMKYFPGTAKAWVLYDGVNASVLASFGVTSVTRDSTGNFTVNWSTAFSSANYAVVAWPSQTTGPNGTMACMKFGSLATGSVGVATFNLSFAFTNCVFTVVAFGDQ